MNGDEMLNDNKLKFTNPISFVTDPSFYHLDLKAQRSVTMSGDGKDGEKKGAGPEDGRGGKEASLEFVRCPIQVAKVSQETEEEMRRKA